MSDKLKVNRFGENEFDFIPFIRLGKSESDNGTMVVDPNQFDGEHDKRSMWYIAVLWLISAWSGITNGAQAFVKKFFSDKENNVSKVLWEMGRDSTHVSSFAVDRFSNCLHRVKYGAAGWRSLEMFYNYHTEIEPQLNNDFDGFLTRFWMGKMENRQAVTNRYKIVVALLENTFKHFAHKPEVRLVSIASGSAQAVIEAMLKCPEINVKAILVDFDQTAINKASEMVKQYGLEDRFHFVCDTSRALERACETYSPHIIEMVGFLDYRPKQKAITLVNRIKKCLSEDGIFLTCNINKNREKPFLDYVLLWPMIYRTEKQLRDILTKGGFEKSCLLYEPFKIHGIAVCKK